MVREAESSSLFELPISPGARRARIGLLLLLNLLLAVAGALLINGYLNKRSQAAHASTLAVTAAGIPERAPPGNTEPKDKEVPSGPGATEPPMAAAEPPPASPPPTEGEITELAALGASKPEPVQPEPVQPKTNRPDTSPEAPPSTAPPESPDSTTKPPSPAASAPLPAPPGAGEGAGEPGFAKPPPEDSEASTADRVRVLSAKISLVVRRHQGQLARCYQSAAKVINPSDRLEGRIRVHFAIHPDGFARSIAVVSNDTGSAVLSKCVVDLVGSWTFPSSGSDSLEFVWPFDFQAE